MSNTFASSASGERSLVASSCAPSGGAAVLLPGLPRARLILGPGRRGLAPGLAGSLALDLAVVLDAPSSDGEESWGDPSESGAVVVLRPLERRLNEGLGRVRVALGVELCDCSSCSLDASVELGLLRVVPNRLLKVGCKDLSLSRRSFFGGRESYASASGRLAFLLVRLGGFVRRFRGRSGSGTPVPWSRTERGPSEPVLRLAIGRSFGRRARRNRGLLDRPSTPEPSPDETCRGLGGGGRRGRRLSRRRGRCGRSRRRGAGRAGLGFGCGGVGRELRRTFGFL